MILVVIGICALWHWWLPLIKQFLKVDHWEVLGQFGDSFGALNALFTGLALLGLAYNIAQQNKIMADNERMRSIEKFEGGFYFMLNHIAAEFPKTEIAQLWNPLNRRNAIIEELGAQGKVKFRQFNASVLAVLQMIELHGRELEDNKKFYYGILAAVITDSGLLLVSFAMRDDKWMELSNLIGRVPEFKAAVDRAVAAKQAGS